MTTPQSGREAFEALVEKWRDAARGIKPSGTWNGNDLAERYEWCADELEAALAQQGREVGEPVAWIHKDGRALLLDESMHRATNPADWNPLYTAAPKQQAVDEAGDESPIYYMRDNHTFKRLSNSVSAALVEIEAEFNAGYTHGMLCSKRSGFKDIHANGNTNRMAFLAECHAALHASLPSKTEVERG